MQVQGRVELKTDTVRVSIEQSAAAHEPKRVLIDALELFGQH